MRQRLGRRDAVSLALLAFVEALGFRAVAPCEVGRLHEGPSQVFVAVLGVALYTARNTSVTKTKAALSA